VAAGTGAVRSLAAVLRAGQYPAGEVAALGWLDVEVWSLGAALVLAAAGLVLARRPGLSRGARALAGLPALALAAVPTLAAGLAGDSTSAAAVRAAAVLAGAGSIAIARARWPRAALLTQHLGRAALIVMLAATGLGLLTGIGVAEAWTAPAASAWLAVGVLGMRRLPGLRSWRALGPGLTLLLAPTLLLGAAGQQVWRIMALTVIAAGVVVVGVVLRWQAPVVLGGLVLAAHAVVQLGPWVVRTVAGQPRWVVLGVVGTLLLVLGATYERRLREMRRLRLKLSGLR
jgi:hypothetical protein